MLHTELVFVFVCFCVCHVCVRGQPWVDEGGVKVALDFAADADSKCDGHQEVYGWSLAALR